MTAAEELRTAAAALRARASVALMDVLCNPYWESEIVPADQPDARYAHGVINGLGGDAAGLAALLTPGAATLLAESLDFAADMQERLEALVDGAPSLDEATWDGKPHPQLAFARVINAKETAR